MFNPRVNRSDDVKDVIHIKVKKYAGYFNPETRSFAVDPHLTTFEDLQKILVEAFNLNGPFHITYLCRDDVGENVFLSMLTDWDLDAAFMTSSDPHLRLKLDAEPYKDGLMSKMKGWDPPDPPAGIFSNNSALVKNILQPVTSSVNSVLSLQNVQKSWSDTLSSAYNKLTVGLGYNLNPQDQCDFFPSKPPLDDAEFRTYLGDNGRLMKPEDLRLRVYHGGISPALRKVVWRMLLNIFPEHLTGKERIAYIKKKTDEYEKLRAKWQAKADTENVKQISNMVWKDVLRTDRSHEFYRGSDDNPNIVALMNILTTFALTHPKVSYCQGMSDLVSPILMVMNNEAQAYICFCGVMIRLQDNFSSHGKAMSIKFKHLAMLVRHYDSEFFTYLQSLGADNMFFCYRWILLEMKREFSFDDAITVLEVMWSSLPPQPPEDDLPLEDFTEEQRKPGLNGADNCGSISGLEKSSSKDLPHHNSSNLVASATKEDHENNQEEASESEERPSLDKSASSGSSTSYSSFDSLSDYHSAIQFSGESPTLPEADFENPASVEKEDVKKDDDLTDRDSVSFHSTTDSINFHSPNVRRRTFAASAPEGDENSTPKLPPPEEFGCGNPFLLFVCLAVLLDERDELISSKLEYDDMVMHFDKMVRKHSPKKVLSKAMKMFAEYLRADVIPSPSM